MGATQHSIGLSSRSSPLDLHILLSTNVLRYKGKYYRRRAVFLKELSSRFTLVIHAQIHDVDSLSDQMIELEGMNVCPIEGDSLREIKHKFSQTIQDLRSSKQLLFVLFPVRDLDFFFLSQLYAYDRLIVWIKANPVEYKLSFLRSYSFLSTLFPFVHSFFDYFYRMYMKRKLSSALVFYTGDITINRRSHLRQYSLVSSTLSLEDFHFRKGPSGKEIRKLLYVGNISYQKGLDFLLEAVVSLDDVELMVVGDGPQLSQYQKQYASSQIKFHGAEYNRAKLLSLMRSHDILVMPSLSEKQGKVYLEAMSQGLVPIVTDVGGVYTIIKNRFNGLMVPAGDSLAIAKAIRELKNNTQLYLRLQDNGKETVSSCTLQRQVSFMADVIEHSYLN